MPINYSEFCLEVSPECRCNVSYGPDRKAHRLSCPEMPAYRREIARLKVANTLRCPQCNSVNVSTSLMHTCMGFFAYLDRNENSHEHDGNRIHGSVTCDNCGHIRQVTFDGTPCWCNFPGEVAEEHQPQPVRPGPWTISEEIGMAVINPRNIIRGRIDE